MNNLNAKNHSRQLIRGIVSVIIGVGIMIYPGLTLKTVIMTMGALLLAEGVVSYILGHQAKVKGQSGFYILPRGLGNIVFGSILLLFPTFMAGAFVFLVGIILIIAGLSQLMAQFSGRKLGGFSLVYSAIAAIAFLGGIFLIANPIESSSTLLVFFGAMVAIYGSGEIFWSIRVRKFIKQNKPVDQTIDAEFEEIE